jgi:radical SAM protein with 4Fe4S-binding SPASM domain
MLRPPASFDKVVANIREFLPIANELNVPVGFVCVLMRDNLPQLADLVDLVADLGGVESRSDLRIQSMLDNASRCADLDVHAHYSEAEICSHLDRAVERAEARGLLFHVDLDAPFRREVSPQEPRIRGVLPDVFIRLGETIRERYPHFCHMGATYLKVSPRGDVHPCCVAADELLMGNLLERPFAEIWNGERYRRFRRRMNTRDYPEVCRTCEHLVANPAFERE